VATSFNATSLERQFAFLDDCPEILLADLVTLPVGTLAERVAGIRQWRKALLAGNLPTLDTWPPDEVAKPARKALAELGLIRFCKDQQELVDALLIDILASFVHQAEVLRSEVANKLLELERLKRLRLSEQEEERAHKEKRSARKVLVDVETLQRLRERAEREVNSQDRPADLSIVRAWAERARAWNKIAEVFGDLGEMMGRGWDLSIGILRHTGWLNLLNLHKQIETLPQIREIVRALGRLHDSENNTSVAEKIFVPTLRVEEELREVRTPLVPAETRGVERSGELTRMLPVEASLLGHSKLRMLWHARRAERALLTYRVEGVETEREWVERQVPEESDGQRPRPERGPILAVIDTSGSMHGLPEQVAKAIILEAMRVAHSEKRKCYLFAYSGPRQIMEQELDLSPEGIGRLLAFLGFSFGGGNDEIGVMMRVTARLQENEWKKADVVFVSDGEWPSSSRLVEMVNEAKENGTRFHGVQIGNRGKTGLHAICEPVHVFQDWAAAGGWR